MSQMTPRPPVYQGYAEYIKGAVGLTKPCQLTLFPDHLEIVSKKNELLLNVPLQALESVNYVRGGLIRMRMNGNELHAIQFASTGSRMFGVLGTLLSGAPRRGTEFADALRSVGVQVGTKTI